MKENSCREAKARVLDLKSMEIRLLANFSWQLMTCIPSPGSFRGFVNVMVLTRRGKMKIAWCEPGYLIAEEEGFEPPVPHGTTVFKTAAIDHSATPLCCDPLFECAKVTEF